MHNILKCHDLTVSYGAKEILHQINTTIPAKQITAIIGPSGGGKSTFLFSLNRLIEERGGKIKGDIRLDLTCQKPAQSILDLPKEELRQTLGMVLQEPAIFPFSVKENLRFVLRYYGLPANDDALLSLLAKVGLRQEVELKQPALSLSGGQKQRLAIARTIAMKPQVLLLDEPCSQLDIGNTELIEKLLLNLKQEMTIVLVTHNLAQAKRIADRVLFILDGKLIETSSKEKIFSNPQRKLTAEYLQGVFG